MPLTRARAWRFASDPGTACRFAVAGVLGFFVAVWLGVWAAAADAPASESVRLRISWGDGEPTQWFGRMTVVDGSLAELQLLGSDADAPGSVWLQDNEVRVASISAHAHDVIEVTAEGSTASKLVLELSTSVGGVPVKAEVLLSDVVRAPYVVKLDERGNTLTIENARDPALSIHFERQPLIFLPGEQLAFDLQPGIAGLASGTTLDLQTTLSAVNSKVALWSDQQRLSVPVDGVLSVRLNIPLPRVEGVHTVRVAATRPPGFRERFFAGTAVPLAERSFQVVVLNTTSTASKASPAWETVLEIDPTNPRWFDRLPSWTQLRRIPGLKSGPMGSLRAGTIEHAFGRFVELPPTAAGREPHWQAYSLPLEAVGAPHQLEVEYPGGDEQHFGISIVEPNSLGVVEAIGVDTGVYVEGLGRSEAKQAESHRVVFWPRTQAPLLLVTNRHPTAAAHFGRIRVRKRTGDRLASSEGPTATGDRLVAAYLGRGLAPGMFGERPLGADNREVASGMAHDWQTHFESATRLADYLRYAGYNSAVVGRLGNGRASTNAAPVSADAAGADALELLLRVFDREELALVPAMQFAAPLAELEQLRRGSDPRTSGLEWVGPNGRSWLEANGSPKGLAPYYNLLDSRVQQAIAREVGALVDRYGHHSALAGIAVQLSSHGYAQLPPLEWGLDDVTVARFQRETGVTLDDTAADRFAARHAQLTGPHAEAWRNWRARNVTDFYSRLAAVVRTGNERRRLLLTTEESFDHPQLATRVRPNILEDNRVDATLMDLGIDRDQLQRAAGVVLCGTRYEGPTVPLRDRAIDLQINDAFEARVRQAAATDAVAGMFFHRANVLALPSFTTKGPFQFASDVVLESQPLAHGGMARQPYAVALAGNDCSIVVDGGQLLPLGQEEVLRPTRLILQQLPTAAAQTEVDRQPVLVRTYSEASRTTVLVVNTCPWPTEAQVHLDFPQAAALEPLAENFSGTAAVPVPMLGPGRQAWPVSLGPYEIQAVRVTAGGVQVADVQIQISPAAKAELAAQIADLNNRDTDPHVYASLANPSFEPIGGGGSLTGWQLSENSGSATAELDATLPHDGTTCLFLQSQGPTAVLQSTGFPSPATGQLAMTVFIRAQGLGPKSELRMVIEADAPGYVYRRSVVVGGVQPAAYPLTDQWRCYPILVNDLPLQSQRQARIKFELTGPGEVWFDEVKTYDLLFPLSFYKYWQTERLQIVKEIQAAQSAYGDNQVTDCVRRLEGYWPRFLAAYTPPVTGPIANRAASKPADKLAAPPKPTKEPAPGLGERFKWIVPKWR